MRLHAPSWPGLSRPSTSCLVAERKTWMPATSAGMTKERPEPRPREGGRNGGGIALGHAVGATGSILIGPLLDELERRDLTRAGPDVRGWGMGLAVVVERL